MQKRSRSEISKKASLKTKLALLRILLMLYSTGDKSTKRRIGEYLGLGKSRRSRKGRKKLRKRKRRMSAKARRAMLRNLAKARRARRR